MAKELTLIDAILPKIEDKALALIKDIVLVLSFAVLTGVCAKWKIEIGVVPITMQTLAVLLSGALLGSKKGAIAQLTYLSMGLVGLPWFARGGGMVYIMSPTFGYIVGFVFAAFLVGYLCEKGLDRKIWTAVLAMVMGNLVIYFFGLLYLLRFVELEKVLTTGLYPFILGDLVKILLAGVILPIGWKLIQNR